MLNVKQQHPHPKWDLPGIPANTQLAHRANLTLWARRTERFRANRPTAIEMGGTRVAQHRVIMEVHHHAAQ